ncbi:hypothetical protein NQT62_00805 [Limnobacter humi]|uniref:Glycerophosphodiester phosphodiesterase n=1 Tax=Limnobacter humi TaxID=1778671 RepID=A0ABT1WBT6_9BURK|nr:hypothetical protein [Limnobacter humi]MCQ8894976.1 hypothetical protein [Limnobacter humi]
MSAHHTYPHTQPLERVQQAVARLPALPRDDKAFWRHDNGVVLGRFQDLVVSSGLSPIAHVLSGERIGHVAHTVGLDGAIQELTFENLDSNTYIASDRLIRALHTLNYFGVSPEPVRLFLDVNQRFFTSVVDNHGKAFRTLIESLGLSPTHFVIQVVANAVTDLSTLAFAADNYRRNGFLTGLHAHSSLEANSLIAQIRPDFLSVWVTTDWNLSELPALYAAAAEFRVTPIARYSGDLSLAHAVQQAGFEFQQVGPT